MVEGGQNFPIISSIIDSTEISIPILWLGWTMPPNAALTDRKPEDLLKTRKFAILVIIFLAVAMRGASFSSVVTGAVMGAIAAAVDHFVRGSVPKAISIYALFILILIFSNIFPLLPQEWFEPLNYALKSYDLTFLIPIVLSGLLVFILWYLKSKFWDRNRISLATFLDSFFIALTATVVVCVAAGLPDKIFNMIVPK
ncbi:MAG: hypothetical protein AB1508_11530 [Pseudomonadota bacterium]